jgi:hypothetical protein
MNEKETPWTKKNLEKNKLRINGGIYSIICIKIIKRDTERKMMDRLL